MSRLLALGDIHGCSIALETLAEFVPLGVDDLLITLGDYVDRSPNSRAVLNFAVISFSILFATVRDCGTLAWTVRLRYPDVRRRTESAG